MISSNIIVESQLDEHIKKIKEKLDSNVLAFCGDLIYGVEEYIRDIVESIQNKKERLVVVLETPGGYVEVVQRIVTVLRQHYKLVDFIVPNLRYVGWHDPRNVR